MKVFLGGFRPLFLCLFPFLSTSLMTPYTPRSTSIIKGITSPEQRRKVINGGRYYHKFCVYWIVIFFKSIVRKYGTNREVYFLFFLEITKDEKFTRQLLSLIKEKEL